MLSKIGLITTWQCNYECLHCLQGHPKASSYFPVSLMEKLLIQARQFGANHLSFTGGEPRFHPEFEDLVYAGQHHGYTWSLVSNGSSVKPYLSLMQETRPSFRKISLSLDGANPKTHDRIRNQDGAFEQAILSAKTYLNNGFDVELKTCINRLNIGEMQEIVDLAVGLGIRRVNFGVLIPTEINQALEITEAEMIKVKNTINEINVNHNSLVALGATSLYNAGGIHFCTILNLRAITFNPLGELLFCCNTDKTRTNLGSLKDNNLSELLLNWIKISERLKMDRLEKISVGEMGPGFDTCSYCRQFFDIYHPIS
jgi:MoaA/NifB/PqqE/SkfB family radical SAM enzyme